MSKLTAHLAAVSQTMTRWLSVSRPRRSGSPTLDESTHPSAESPAVADFQSIADRPANAALQAPAAVMPFDPHLLTRARTQWQFGDWQSLAQLAQDQHHLAHHPQRAELRILATAGALQAQPQPDAAAAKAQLKQSLEEGASREAVARMLIAGVYNSLGRAAAIRQRYQQASQNFRTAIETGMPGEAIDLVAQARSLHELEKLPFKAGVQRQLAPMGLVPDLERTPGFLELDQIYQDRLRAAFLALDFTKAWVKLPDRFDLTDYPYWAFKKIKCLRGFEFKLNELNALFYSSSSFILPVHIIDTPHYRYAEDFLEGRDCAHSRALYQEYRRRQFPEEDQEEKSRAFEMLMEKIREIYKYEGSVGAVELLVSIPKSNVEPRIYDGLHRAAILSALGLETVLCALDLEDFLNPNKK